MHLLFHAVCAFFAIFTTSVSAIAATPNYVKKPTAPKSTEAAFSEHKVKKGETLWGIAQKHSTSVGEIMDCNQLPNETVRDGMTLKIPGRKKNIPIKLNPSRETESIKEVATPSKPPTKTTPPGGTVIHSVTENETFYSISKKYGLSMESVVTANPTVKPEQLRTGMKVVIPKPTTAKSKEAGIKAGENKAKTPGTSSTNSTSADNKASASENRKTVTDTPIKSPVQQKEPPAKPVVVSSKPVMTNPAEVETKPIVDDGIVRSYIVSAGEDESTISEAFGITKKQLLEYNRLSSSTKLKPGDEIMIPRAVK